MEGEGGGGGGGVREKENTVKICHGSILDAQDVSHRQGL